MTDKPSDVLGLVLKHIDGLDSNSFMNFSTSGNGGLTWTCEALKELETLIIPAKYYKFDYFIYVWDIVYNQCTQENK